MSSIDPSRDTFDREAGPQPEIILAEVVPEQPARARPRRRKFWLPLGLFVATCLSTWYVGGLRVGILAAVNSGDPGFLFEGMLEGLKYAVPLMIILVCHEAGHFIQARRYGVRASLPFFIPMPFPPLGTMGAVIAMEARIGDRRSLFDIGITGPLAGLVPTLAFCTIGMHLSEYNPGRDAFGDPLLFEWIARCVLGPRPAGEVICAHPMAFAGWVGLLLTGLNLLPVGQLDGGHVLYALLRTRAHQVASLLLLAAAAAIVYFGYYVWMLMLMLLMFMGPNHPPTANDNVRLGPIRTTLGWLTLAFILVGFTPTPFLFE